MVGTFDPTVVLLVRSINRGDRPAPPINGVKHKAKGVKIIKRTQVKTFEKRKRKETDLITVVFEVDKEFSLKNKYHVCELFEALEIISLISEGVTEEIWNRYIQRGLKSLFP